MSTQDLFYPTYRFECTGGAFWKCFVQEGAHFLYTHTFVARQRGTQGELVIRSGKSGCSRYRSLERQA